MLGIQALGNKAWRADDTSDTSEKWEAEVSLAQHL